LQPKATAHLGTCSQRAGEGEVVTSTADPLDLSRCSSCMAAVLATGSGIRSAIVKRWRWVNRRAAAQQAGRRAGAERQARGSLKRTWTLVRAGNDR
jgi:hypothetical protein